MAQNLSPPSIAVFSPLALSLLLAAGACSGGGGDGSGPAGIPAGDEAFTPPPVDDGGGRPNDATSDTCASASDCAYWFCECADGAVVNAANCTNGYCLAAAGACPAACDYFDHGPWTGRFGGGPQAPGDPGDPGPQDACGDLGSSDPVCDACARDACCGAMAACDGNAACLDYWDCAAACEAFDTLCQQDCEWLHPGGVSDYDALASCLGGQCSAECG